MTEFDTFWAAYPRRVGKLKAQAAYVKARRLTSAEVILAAVEQYARLARPPYVAHPTTWLNAGRWMDDEGPIVMMTDWTCPHTPHCPHRAACVVVALRGARV